MHKSGGGCQYLHVFLHLWSGTRVCVCLDWEAISGSQPPEDRTAFWINLEAPRLCKTRQGQTWWVKISKVSPVDAALALGMEHSNANTRRAASLGW